MDLIITAAVYALFGDVLATFLAATVAILIRHRVSGVAIGAGLGASAGFILGVAFFDLIPQAQLRSHDDLIIALGIAIGLSLMVIIDRWLEKYGMGEKEEGDEKKDRQDLRSRKQNKKGNGDIDWNGDPQRSRSVTHRCCPRHITRSFAFDSSAHDHRNVRRERVDHWRADSRGRK